MERELFDKLLKDYLEDSEEFIDAFDGLLSELESMLGEPPNATLLHQILSKLHTFKGNSAVMGMDSLASYTHAVEDVFKTIEKGSVQLNRKLVEQLYGTAKSIRKAISSILSSPYIPPVLDEETAALNQTMTDEKAAHPEVSEVTSSSGISSDPTVFRQSNVLRVEFERLDHLLNLMSELVVQRTTLGQQVSRLQERFAGDPLIEEIGDTVEKVGSISSDLHEAIMNVRMLPIRQVFTRFPSYVRELARSFGKEVQVSVEGENTELDKKIIDEIGEPLMHLVRNAVDHGIESVAERKAAGKARTGTIKLRSYQESNRIVITVEDDGRGIDIERLRDIATRSGHAVHLGDVGESLRELIFLPGLSTAENVSEVSGRGVGMDVVKSSLSRINATIQVETQVGHGTRFTISLPLTLAIISALLVNVCDERYAIPLSQVIESHKLSDDDIQRVNGKEVFNLRGSVVPLVRLAEHYGSKDARTILNLFVVFVRDAVGMIGLLVDGLTGQQEIVVKTLNESICDAFGVAGATILGDGSVVMIVDTSAFTQGVAGSDLKQGVANVAQ